MTATPRAQARRDDAADPPRLRGRVISDCHFRKTASEYDRKPGIKWLRCTEKCQSDITLLRGRLGARQGRGPAALRGAAPAGGGDGVLLPEEALGQLRDQLGPH